MPDTLDRTAQRAATSLRAVRELWGDLLAAIDRPPVTEWPPRESRTFLDPAAGPRTDGERPTIGRLPLTLREHPAPLNLDALATAMDIEECLFEQADAIAELVQRPVRRHLVGRRTDTATLVRWAEDQADRDDPARWTLPTYRTALLPRPAQVLTGTDPRTDADHRFLAKHHAAEARARTIHAQPEQAKAHRAQQPASEISLTSAGSRAHGLHWAAVWLEGRALNEGVTAPRPSNTVHVPLFTPLPPRHLYQLAAAADWSRRQLERVLGRDGRRIEAARPCPYCHVGTLTARTHGGDPAQTTVTCSTGEACPAPVMLEQGRRVWRGAELTGLYVAVAAAQRRTQG